MANTDPFPEVVDQRRNDSGWTIKRSPDGSAKVDKRARILVVPMDEDESMRDCARHELGHVRWSPVVPPTVPYSPHIVNALEDARINLALRRAGVPMEIKGASREMIARAFDTHGFKNPSLAVLAAIAACGDAGLEPLAKRMVETMPDRGFARVATRWLDRAQTLFGGTKTPSFDVVKREADLLATELTFEADKQPELEPQPAPRTPPPVMPREGDMTARGAEPSEGDDQGEDEQPAPPAPRASDEPAPPADNGRVNFGSQDTEERGTRREEDRRDLSTVGIAEADPAELAKAREEAKAELAKGGTAQLSGRSLDARRGTIDDAIVKQVLAKRTLDREYRKKLEARWEQLHIKPGRRPCVPVSSRAVRFGNGGRDDCGELFINSTRLSVPQLSVANRDARVPRCAPEGALIRRIDRLCIDGAIFGRRAQTSGACVLLDQSGSMDVSVSETEALCLAAGKGATVATYSGDGRTGELRIVAQGSMRGEEAWFRPVHAGNTVDYPALVWLSRQPGRKIWVSDYGVTGLGDCRTPALLEAVRALVAEHRIEVYPKVAAAADALRR